LHHTVSTRSLDAAVQDSVQRPNECSAVHLYDAQAQAPINYCHAALKEVESSSRSDKKLAELPVYMYKAFNCGDLKAILDLISTHFHEQCTYQTMLMERPLVGRIHVYKHYEAFTVTHPDIIWVTKANRVVVDSEGEVALALAMCSTLFSYPCSQCSLFVVF
jgi:hypothetical protein